LRDAFEAIPVMGNERGESSLKGNRPIQEEEHGSEDGNRKLRGLRGRQRHKNGVVKGREGAFNPSRGNLRKFSNVFKC